MQQVRAKKFLGQHFLRDLTVAQKIAETLNPVESQKSKAIQAKDNELLKSGRVWVCLLNIFSKIHKFN